MDFYHFFSFSAKKAIYRSSEVCAQFNNQYLEPEHILYSILNLRSCSAVQILTNFGVNLPKFTYSVEAYLYEHSGNFKGTASFSARTLSLLDESFKEVKQLNHREIGTCHLLVGLAQERGSFLRELFTEHDLDAKTIRDTYMKHLKGYSQDVLSESSYAHESKTRGSSAGDVVEEMFDARLREVLYLAAYLAKRLKHGTIEPVHVMYALTTRIDGLELVQQAWGLDPLKPSAVLSVLVGELDNLPLASLESDKVPHSNAVAKVTTKAFEAAFAGGISNITFPIFVDEFLGKFKKRWRDALAGCVLQPGELPDPPDGDDDDPDDAAATAGVRA